MKVWRAIGESYVPGDDAAYSAACEASGALFVAPTESQAIAWALHLWHRAEKHDVVCIEVSRIRDRNTLKPIAEFQASDWLHEFIHAGDGGFNIVQHDFRLFEAVVLASDIL